MFACLPLVQINGTVACVCLVPLATLLVFLGLKTNVVVSCVLLVTLASLYVAYTLARDVLSIRVGDEHEDMLAVSEPIREGAEGFFRTQYGTIARLSIVVFFAILVIYMFRQLTPEQEAAGISRGMFAVVTALSFLLGAFMSGLAGYSGMWVSVRANIRVTIEAKRAMRPALWVALRAGGFAAMAVTGLTVLGVTFLFALCHVVLGIEPGSHMKPSDVPMLLVGYGFGASFVALFAQLGGVCVWVCVWVRVCLHSHACPPSSRTGAALSHVTCMRMHQVASIPRPPTSGQIWWEKSNRYKASRSCTLHP
jgi:hypothetical protein